MRLLTGFELFTDLLRVGVPVTLQLFSDLLRVDVFFNAARINAAISGVIGLVRRVLDFLVGVPIYIYKHSFFCRLNRMVK